MATFLSFFGIHLSPLYLFLDAGQEGVKRTLWRQPTWNFFQWTLNSVLFHFLCLPMAIIQILSFTEYTSAIFLVSLSLNLSFCGVFLLGFLLGIVFERSPRKEMVLLEEYPGEQDEPEPEKEGTEEPNMTNQMIIKIFRLLLWLIAPLFALAILCQCLFPLGIPYSLRSAKRFISLPEKLLRNSQRHEEQEGKEKEEMSWVETRGLFLVPISLIFFWIHMLFILPLISLVALLLWLFDNFSRRKKEPHFREFKTSCQLLVAWLFFCFLPFLSEPPSLGTTSEQEETPLWILILSLVWFVAFEIGLVLFDIVSDILFSLQLFELWRDPILDRREELFAWVILSFAATLCGLVFWILFFLTQFALVSSNKLRYGSWKKYVVDHSPFGYLDSRSLLLIRGMNGLFEDVLQLIVSVNTLSFVGTITGIWGLKLTISLASACLTVSKTMTAIFFGGKRNKLLRFWTQMAWFSFVGILLSLIVSQTIGTEFCELSRSVKTREILTVLSRCETLPERAIISEMEVEQGTATFKAWALGGTLEVKDNQADLTLRFENLREIEGNLSISSNAGSVGIVLSQLTTLRPGSSLLFSHNHNISSLSALFLVDLQEGSLLEVETSLISLPLQFAYLSRLEGKLLLRSSLLPELAFLGLGVLRGKLAIESCQVGKIDFPSLAFLWGSLKVSSNENLQTLELTSLVSTLQGSEQFGELLVENNPSLKLLSFPSAEEINFVIRNNSQLERVELGTSAKMVADSLISDNPFLEVLDLKNLREIEGLKVLKIAGNERLKEIDLSGWFCDGNVDLEGNPSLELVKIPSLSCLQFIRLWENPNFGSVVISS